MEKFSNLWLLEPETRSENAKMQFFVVVVVKGAKFTVKGFQLHYLDLNDILRVEVRPPKSTYIDGSQSVPVIV